MLLYATLRYSTLLTLLNAALLYATLRYYTLLYAILLYFTPLYAILLYSTLLYSTLLYSTPLYATLLVNILFTFLVNSLHVMMVILGLICFRGFFQVEKNT
jgi:hypothetical protein